MENCENCVKCETKMKLLTKQSTVFWLGLLLCAIAVITFFVGMFGAAREPLWIATTVIGALSLLLLAFSTHSVDGWTRMFSVFFMEILIIIGTVMAVYVSLA